jgi:hypothetical protein
MFSGNRSDYLCCMKRLLFAFVLLAIVAQSMNKLWVQVHFFWNQKQITQTQCEQRFNPGSGCGGCCQLRKNLRQTENKNENTPCKLKSAEIQLFIEDRSIQLPEETVNLPHNTSHFFYKETKEQRMIHAVFKPPIRIGSTS